MTAVSTVTMVIGRYTLALSVDASGRVRETWAPRNPIRLTGAELQAYRQARRAFVAPPIVKGEGWGEKSNADGGWEPVTGLRAQIGKMKIQG